MVPWVGIWTDTFFLSGPRVGIFDRLTLISDDVLKKPDQIFEQTEDWALVHRSHVVFTRNMEISGQEINTYKPFYNYINIDLYLYVKSSHYVLFKTRVGVFYQI